LRPLDGNRVREIRHQRMFSQQEVADRAGTSLFTIQRIERGEGNVRPKTGRALATALGVPVEDLLPKLQGPLPFPQPEEAEAGRELKSDDFAVMVVEAYEKVAREAKSHTRTFADIYTENLEGDAWLLHKTLEGMEGDELLRLSGTYFARFEMYFMLEDLALESCDADRLLALVEAEQKFQDALDALDEAVGSVIERRRFKALENVA
jgi:transcriptional regulator with XRE-family HTH domain